MAASHRWRLRPPGRASPSSTARPSTPVRVPHHRLGHATTRTGDLPTSKRHAKEATMAPEHFLEQVKLVAQAFARGNVCKTLLDLADNDVERIRRQAEFDEWDRRVAKLWAELTAAVNTALPPTLYALPDPFAPVITPNNSGIELRG